MAKEVPLLSDTFKPRLGPARLVVISGPSGSGKTTVVRNLRTDHRVTFSVSATTRQQREGERDGVDYHFLSREAFESGMAKGEFLETAYYNGNLYGTLRAPMERALAAGRLFVLEIEVQGTRLLRDQGVQGLYVFLVPPSLEVLRERLVRRGQNSPQEIEARLAIAAEEMRARDLYDVVIVNEDIEKTIHQVRQVIGL